MSQHFFAMINRMKFINRWGLMRNTISENISEHSHQVAVIAHGLAVIGNEKYACSYNPDRAALLGLYHDTTEILTGDLPTPVKYHDPNIVNAYREVERRAGERLLEMLPEEFLPHYRPFFEQEEADLPLWALVKAADKISALLKSMEELNAGNREFASAVHSLTEQVSAIDLPEVRYFVDTFLPSYSLTLDEHTK